ncbi:MAG: ABC transporter permease, partial [Planctomycetota bacterium]
MTGWRAGIAAAFLMLALWQTVIWTTGVARFILPPPALVAQTIWESRALLAEHAVITMAEVLIGLALGAVLGFVSAIGLVASPTARALVRPILVFSQS